MTIINAQLFGIIACFVKMPSCTLGIEMESTLGDFSNDELGELAEYISDAHIDDDKYKIIRYPELLQSVWH